MKRVMIVDDSSFLRLSLKRILIAEGFEVVVEAVDGLDAIEKYEEYNPDIVSMDITMPSLNGIDAIKELKKIDNNVNIIVISSLGQESQVKKAFLAGATNFVVKPFQESFVKEAFNKIL
ncbi:response regulator [Clostridium sp. YIM B02505]|uniref:Stage 0 sporulation protein A homolog n=1 Tax=Clostridium yunnanense TaxID=2800325 RepID=A0ABS1EL80_9CLOT|nr:response regulator [Clostridium yunnanense]MBK1810073.1 response regulator [Clostridium yunnanense]